MCVCVCVREREREREFAVSFQRDGALKDRLRSLLAFTARIAAASDVKESTLSVAQEDQLTLHAVRTTFNHISPHTPNR